MQDDLDRIIQEYKDSVPKNRRRFNARHQREYIKRHNVKSFCVNFREDENLNEILDRLSADGITRKEFIKQAFELYKKMGGFEKREQPLEKEQRLIFERQTEILTMIKANPKETINSLKDHFHVKQLTIARDIAELKKGGYLVRKGGNTVKGHWEVTNKAFLKREI